MRKSSKAKGIVDPENPPLTRAQLGRFRPSREVVPHIVDAYLRRRGRPTQGEEAKVQVTLRLDPAIIAYFRGRGAGWQTRINDELMKVIGKKQAVRKKTSR